MQPSARDSQISTSAANTLHNRVRQHAAPFWVASHSNEKGWSRGSVNICAIAPAGAGWRIERAGEGLANLDDRFAASLFIARSSIAALTLNESEFFEFHAKSLAETIAPRRPGAGER